MAAPVNGRERKKKRGQWQQSHRHTKERKPKVRQGKSKDVRGCSGRVSREAADNTDRKSGACLRHFFWGFFVLCLLTMCFLVFADQEGASSESLSESGSTSPQSDQVQWHNLFDSSSEIDTPGARVL